MGAGALILNQPGVYLVDVDGNAITVTDGLAIGSAEALIIAGKDGANARFVRVASDGTVRIDPTGTTTQPISASSLPLPTGAATSALQTQPGVDIGDVTVNNAGGGAAVNIQDGGNSITVDGPLTDTELRASAVPVSVSSLPLPSGAATEATLATRASEASLVAQSLVDNAGFTDGTTRVVPSGFVFDETAGTALTENDIAAARIDDKRAQVYVIEDAVIRGRRLTVTASNAAKVDGSAVTQPVSAASLPLPTGAATEATLALVKTSTDNLDVALSTRATEVTLATRLADATFTARINTLGQKTMANSTPVVLSSDQAAIPVTDNGGSLTVDGTVTANQGTAAALASAWPVQVTDGTNTMPTMDTAARSGWQRLTDGTNGPVAVKNASTAPVVTDKSLVVVLSPNDATLASRLADSTFTARVNVLGQNTASNSTPVVLASDQTAIPVTDNGGSITVDATSWPLPTGAATEATLATILTTSAFQARINTLGQKTMANSTPIVIASDQTAIPVTDNGNSLTVDGTVTANQGTAAALSGYWPVRVTDGTNTLPTMDAVGRAGFQKVTDGTNTVAVKAASTAPVVADPAFVVVISPNQQAIPVSNSPSNATTGIAYGEMTTTATTNVVVRKTAYTEPSSNAQRSVASSNANDTSAGTGARTIRLTYYTATFTGPFTESITLNGTSSVNTVATDICYIEKIEVLTVGSGGTNAGTISLFGATGGGGGTVGTIAIGDGRTFWAHHYVATSKSCYITGLTGNNNHGSNVTVFMIKAKDLSVASSPEQQISDTVIEGGGTGQNTRAYNTPIKVTGPARVSVFGAPAGTPSIISRSSFDFYDQ